MGFVPIIAPFTISGTSASNSASGVQSTGQAANKGRGGKKEKAKKQPAKGKTTKPTESSPGFLEPRANKKRKRGNDGEPAEACDSSAAVNSLAALQALRGGEHLF